MEKVIINNKSRAEDRGTSLTSNEVEEFYKVSQVLSSSLNLKKTLSVVAENLTKFTGAKFCDIYFLEKKDCVKYAYSYGKKPPHYDFRSYSLKTSVYSKKVLETQKPIEVEDLTRYALLGKDLNIFFKKEKICCLLYLPIIKNGVSIGFVRLYRSRDTAEPVFDLMKVMSLVNQMAVAIENSRMHERLNQRKARWQSIFEDASEGMLITNQNFKILEVNNAFLNIMEESISRIKGRSIKKLLANKEDRDWIEANIKSKKENKLQKDVLLEAKEKVIWTSMKISVTDDPQDNSIRLIFSFEDITKEKELESSKNEFVSIVSHELRSPLTAVRGYLGLLGKKDFGPMSKKQKKFLQRVTESTDRMANLVENLLDVNRIDTGKIQLIFDKVDVIKIFKVIKKDFTQQLKEKKLELKIVTDLKSLEVWGDKDRLYQIIYNLLGNAIKYSFPKGKIEVGFKIEKNYGILYIKDNGVGIPLSQQKKLFSKFSRVDNELSISAGGSGLGLYIVKNLVTAHNGQIWVESKEGEKGAKFLIQLPLSK